MYLVGFIIRIYHDARSPERQIRTVIIPMNTHKNNEVSLNTFMSANMKKHF